MEKLVNYVKNKWEYVNTEPDQQQYPPEVLKYTIESEKLVLHFAIEGLTRQQARMYREASSCLKWYNDTEEESLERCPLQFIHRKRNKKAFTVYYSVEMDPEIFSKYLTDDNHMEMIWTPAAVFEKDSEIIGFRLTASSNPIYIQERRILFHQNVLYSLFLNDEGYVSLHMKGMKHYTDILSFPVYADSMIRENGRYMLRGFVSAQLRTMAEADVELGLLIKKRGEQEKRILPIGWTDVSCWTASMPADVIADESGVWDFYFYTGEDTAQRLHRVKTALLEPLNPSICHVSDRTVKHVEPYETVYHGLSVNVTAETIMLRSFHADFSENVCRLSGEFPAPELEDSASFTLLMKKRDSDAGEQIELKTTREQKNISFQAMISEEELFQDGCPESVRWNIYIEAHVQGAVYLYRLKSRDIHLQNTTFYEKWSEESLYYTYFYPSVSNRLTFVCRPADYIRRLKNFRISDGVITLRGTACIVRKNPEDVETQKIYIIIKSRETEKMISIEAKKWEQAPFKKLPIYRNEPAYADWTAEAELSSFLDIQADRDILDFYVCIEDGPIRNEKKLGYRYFTYKKDGVKKHVSLETGEKTSSWYFELTPHGNLKTDVNVVDTDDIKRLKEANEVYINNLPPEREVWVVGERPDTAQENGYHFFQYCRLHFPEMEIYYAIEADSPDYHRVKQLGNVLIIGSSEHMEVCLKATAFIASHDIEYILPFKGMLMESYKRGTRVFLQHGVLGRKRVEYDKQFYRYPFQLFCVSSKKEKKIVNEEMGYKNGAIRVTGLARFDHLKHAAPPENRILLMPTWRDWLYNKNTFTESEYFQRYASLLKNEKLAVLLEEYNLTLDFYPHYRMQPFIESFQFGHSERIRVVPFGRESVQELLMKAALLVTDYSSVSFDFNYLQRPVLFYHFDQERFFEHGSLRPLEETFLGETAESEEELIHHIHEAAFRNFTESEGAAANKKKIFTFEDDRNAERIFEAIMKKRLSKCEAQREKWLN
ncbi:CDP-glycerol glycerophosphotransferase family protein [Alteribacillus sp. HJP-4]|uniref:CDP-glycerol glycerophosphotransferase family protein n=1 Tax=Alteribacillus sp. HJP-4 TaxID=2775394 RepID=UPI0035CCF1F0